MQFLNIPANYNFLQSLYFYIKNVFKNNLEMSNVTILLPSRYSSNELKRVFLENSKDNTTILPIIKAIGDIDYDDLILNNLDLDILNSNINLIKPISNTKYKLLLIREILKYQPNVNINKAINLSMDLELFLNEVKKNNLTLDNLDEIVDDEYSIHWQKVLDFIKVFGEKWENFLIENNIVSNNTHALQIINTYKALFEKKTPKNPIIIVGNFLSVNSTMNLVKTLKKYDNIYFIFKGFENNLTNEEFENLEENYSHFYFKKIVKELYIRIKDIKKIEFADCIVTENNTINVLNNAMLPAYLTYKWHNNKIKELKNIKFVECDNTYEELNLISFYIIDFFKKNGLKNIAIIANKDYSREIEIFLKRWNLPINNNFGINFMSNKLVKYLFLVINAYKNDFTPEFLLSLLKNEYVNFNYKKEDLQNLIDLFEKYVLNSNVNNSFSSYIKNIEKIENNNIKNKLNNFINNIRSFFKDFDKNKELSFEEFIELHIKIAEKIADNSIFQKDNTEQFMQSDMFYDEKNEKIIEFIKELLEQGNCFGKINLDDYIVLLSSLFAEKTYKENYTIYPAVNIISAEESRLVNYDLVIIPNLNDGVFPVNRSTDPYMSKSMRVKFGLPAKEVEIGKYCYDFIQLLAQKNVLLTRAKKIDNTVTFKSRFLQKLEIYLKCNGIILNSGQDIVNIYKEYINIPYNSEKYGIYKKAPRPKPNEKLTKLSATNIDLLCKNPYEIYVKKFLKLYKFNVIEKQNTDALVGTIIHKVFELYCIYYDKYKNNFNSIIELIKNILDEYDDKIIAELYFDKIVSIVQDFIEMDNMARVEGYSIFAEVGSELFFPKKDFILTARIDRIENLNNNVRIIDYKTGGEIAKSAVIDGEKLQLLIEALILKKTKNFVIENLQYWMTKYKKNNKKVIEDKDCNLLDLMNKTEKKVLDLLHYFNNENHGYIATLKNKDYSDYNLLARLDEWEVE